MKELAVKELAVKELAVKELAVKEITLPEGAAPKSTPKRKLGKGAPSARNIKAWGHEICTLLDGRFTDEPDMRRAALEKALELQCPLLSVDGDALEQSGAQTLKRRLAKIVGGSCTEAEALPKLLAALPPKTVLCALHCQIASSTRSLTLRSTQPSKKCKTA